MTGRAINYFLGGNTSQGFYSHFSYIISQEDAVRLITLKGGPGTGKSSLMKRIGKYYLERNYDVEFHHCSSDDHSLDGIVIKDLNFAMLDGTAPHMTDPKNPGAVDEIINMAVCLNDTNLKTNKKNILDTSNTISKTFKRAYRFFAAAKDVYEDWYVMNNDALNLYELNILKENLKDEILPTFLSCPGKVRHLFNTAFTPNGIVTYIDDTVKDYDDIYILKGGPGTGKTRVLSYIAEEASRRGLYVEILHTPLIPQRIEHILIPELNTAILTCNEITHIDVEGKVYNMDSMLDEKKTAENAKKIEESSLEFYRLLNLGLKCLTDAKSLHDVLEAFYAPNMDFSKADKIYDELIERINNYIFTDK